MTTRPSAEAIAQAFWEARDGFYTGYGLAPSTAAAIEARARELDAGREDKPVGDWPDYVMLRDTKLHDDMGGLGQRIFTTAGAGYAKIKYVRHDLTHPQAAEVGEAVQALPAKWRDAEKECAADGSWEAACAWQKCADELTAALAAGRK
jgi:hypothetical protein